MGSKRIVLGAEINASIVELVEVYCIDSTINSDKVDIFRCSISKSKIVSCHLELLESEVYSSVLLGSDESSVLKLNLVDISLTRINNFKYKAIYNFDNLINKGNNFRNC